MGAPIGIGICFLYILLVLPVTILRLYALCGFAIVALHVLVGVYQGPDPKADFNRARKFTALCLIEACNASRHLSRRWQTRQLGSDFTSYSPATGAEAIKGKHAGLEVDYAI